MKDTEVLADRNAVGSKSGLQMGKGSEVITALDAVSLYPSISKDLAMEVCK